jgi:membrane-associated protein
MQALWEFVVHFGPDSLRQLMEQFHLWVYGILFVIVFAETGLVVTPFLPGDSLLFAAGFICATGGMNIWLLCGLLIVAAILGDTLNYHIGKFLGPRVLRGEKSWLFSRKHLDRTQAFFDKHGAKTIILARFVPIVRTYAPFVAGVGQMQYRKFLLYNCIGGVVWVAGFLLMGFFLGRIPWVEENLKLVTLLIVGVSVLPIAVEFVRHWLGRKEPAVKPTA